MQVSFTPILLLRMGSLLEVLEIKELGQRQAGVPHRRSLTFLPQAEGKMYDRKIIKDGEEMILKFQPGLLPAVGVSKT